MFVFGSRVKRPRLHAKPYRRYCRSIMRWHREPCFKQTCLPVMKAGTEEPEHTPTTALARSDDSAGATKKVNPTTTPSARGSNPRGMGITLLPCREDVKPFVGL